MCGVARALRCTKLRKLREHPVLPLGSAQLLQLVEGRAAARLLRGQGGEATPQRRSVRCTPVQHSAAWWAACWCCARCLRGGFGAVLPAAASGARHARRRAWPGWRQGSALDEPAGAARAPCKLAHRLHAAVNSLVDGGQSHDCRSKPAGFVTPFTPSFFGLAFSFAWFYFVFSFAKRRRGGRAGANYGQLHVEGSRTTTRRLGRLGRAAPSRTGRVPYPARRRSHSDV